MVGSLIFVSYATKDVNLYRIPEIADALTTYDEIKDVLYWQEDMHDNIIKYMNDNLGKCDVVLLFCSPNALKSKPVEDEWMAAKAMDKPIIPVFVKTEHIPPLLRSRLGVEFDSFDFEKNIQELYKLILKKIPKKDDSVKMVEVPEEYLEKIKQKEDHAKSVLKAMTDKNIKTTDLLIDFNDKLDDIKNDSELIKEYVSQVEKILDKKKDPESFLIERLGSTDFEKIKSTWQEYKAGKIEKNEVIKEGIKVLGKKFLKIFLTV
ncbi:MAG: toll/interleukin-1 receptor domain-containing protein [Promethearchaeota archaeon]